MLSFQQFKVLQTCLDMPSPSQRQIVEHVDFSLGTVNTALKDLKVAGLVDDDNAITPAGLSALEPHRVDNAIIMAAGLSSRFAPISYEKPKGVMEVCGEVLVERQIEQLQAAGIADITVVVGYKKECFFYLEDKYGVRIIVNPDYAERNNNSTIKRVEHLLGNTYICSSDDYFTENPFERYVYDSYYAAVFEEGKTDEYCLTVKGKENLITSVTVGGENAWVMMGHAYWSRRFSQTFCQILDRIYDEPTCAPKLWEDIYIEHIDELPMVMRAYRHGVIWEFDSLDEVRAFDKHFIDNIDSEILDNICTVLHCERREISDIVPIKQGLTNLSFRFTVGENVYVYRHPGVGTDAIISRKSETVSQETARDLGLDDTFIFEDPETGWKISHFVTVTDVLDYHNDEHVKMAMRMARRLHSADADTGFLFDIHEDTLNTIALLDARRRTSFADFQALFDMAEHFNEKAKAQGARICLCHNDFYPPNFLIAGDKVSLIDWEYSGMSDYASDIAVFVCCCEDYTYDDAVNILRAYFDREPTSEELFHCIAYLCVVSFHWFVWSLYQDMTGSPVGSLLYTYYKYTKLFGAAAQKLEAEADEAK